MSTSSQQQNSSGAGRIKRCFVVSPIGKPGSDTREHADAVFEDIIRLATKEAGYDVHRADHDTGPGKITEQMFDSIFTDDLIIAVLTDRNRTSISNWRWPRVQRDP
jgi:hypothetical protein